MRTFTFGSGADRRLVMIEVQGTSVVVTDKKADGTAKRKEKELLSEDQARKALEQMARELASRGYVEQARNGPSQSKPKSKPAATPSAKLNAALLFEEDADVATTPSLPPRAAAAASADDEDDAPAAKAAKKKSGRKKKRKKASGGGDGLDMRVMAGVGAIGALLAVGLLFFIYDSFLKTPSIVGVWAGSRTEHEISRYVRHTTYGLILDDQHHAASSIEGGTRDGTYMLQGDMLTLTFKDEDGEIFQEEYKVALGSVTLDLFDPKSGKKIVQLVRQRAKPVVAKGGGAKKKEMEAPGDLAAGKVDAAADAKLASVEFTPKDGAFKVRHPAGWTVETGSRPDNTYSWGRFTKGSGKIQIFADVAGSLMSGSDSAHNVEEGSEFAPVHRAHELYTRTVSEMYSEFQESEPTVFKGAPVGEGRLAAFTASAGGLFGGKLKGYRVTLLTSNRRLTVLCEAPEKEFESLKPTFLAVCRSVSY
jgi:hypothetical protein